MSSIPKQRRIIDRAALVGELDALIADGRRPQEVRGDLLDLLKRAMAGGRDEVCRRFDAGEASGEEVAEALSFLTDQIVRLIYDFATDQVYPAANPTEGERLCVAAVGGLNCRADAETTRVTDDRTVTYTSRYPRAPAQSRA